ncbi:MAG: NAD(+) synthase [Bacteroidales bacterium]
METIVPFTADILKLDDIQAYVENISEKIHEDVLRKLRRRGGVIGVSGGIDSSVTLALAVKALGKENVLAVMMPEKDSSPDSLEFGKLLAEKFQVKYKVENITPVLDGFGCYKRRDEAVKRVFPDYNPQTHTFKIGLKESSIESGLPPLFYITLVNEKGEQIREKLQAPEFLQIMAASNFKQRTRMCMLYYHAEQKYYAVIGTSNKQEINQGFFVKHGDGGVDVMAIGHLYKTQVYQLADYLGVPEEIINRTPTTDTYSAEQTQEEFFFQLPFKEMDLLWYAYENNYEPEDVSEVVHKSTEAVKNIFNSFDRKKKTTEYLRMPPVIYSSV